MLSNAVVSTGDDMDIQNFVVKGGFMAKSKEKLINNIHVFRQCIHTLQRKTPTKKYCKGFPIDKQNETKPNQQ